MQVAEKFTIAGSPELVFDYVTDPANLSSWQTSTMSVEPLTEGPPRRGSRYRERIKGPLGRGFEQVVEFSEFERAKRFRVHIIEGPYPVDGTWLFEPLGDATMVHFTAQGELRGPMKLLEPLVKRALARQFGRYHENLQRNLEPH